MFHIFFNLLALFPTFGLPLTVYHLNPAPHTPTNVQPRWEIIKLFARKHFIFFDIEDIKVSIKLIWIYVSINI